VARPVLQALLLADHVYQDVSSGKWIICGVFHKLVIGDTPQFSPSDSGQPVAIPVEQLRQAGSPFAYISLTDVHGELTFDIRYVDLSNNTVLFGANFRVESRDRFAVIQLAVPFPRLPPKEGEFIIELLWEDNLLGSHRIHCERIPPKLGETT
jgi:hypothetical protein